MFGSRSPLPPRSLMALIAGVTVVPLAALLWLGWTLLDQDRALEAQQIRQRLDRSADLVVAALERSLSAWEQRLAAGGSDWPDGAVSLTLRGEDIGVTPRARVAFLPVVPTLPEPPSAAFTASDDAEFRTGEVRAALAAYRELAASRDPSVRAGGLLGLARVQQNAGRADAALATYGSLLKIDDVRIGEAPAALIARYARCRLLESHNRTQELGSEARQLLEDLHTGRWTLTAPVYWLYVADAARWTGTTSDGRRPEEIFAAGVAKLHERWQTSHRTEQPASGREVMHVGEDSVTVLWRSTSDSFRALLVSTAFGEKHWLPGAQDVAREQKVVFATTNLRSTRDGTSPPASDPSITRNAIQSGLPWNVSVANLDSKLRSAEFVQRRQLLTLGFLLLVSMALLASYLIVRAISRGLAVARLQSDFVAAVSHEFRTPLTTLRQFTDMLREHPVVSEERRRLCYDAQSRATDRLTRLVESLLDFGRMEAGARSYTFEPHDCTELVREVVDDFRSDARAGGHDVRFRGNGAAAIQADRDGLSLAVWNLLDNAVKYSPGADTVEVDIHRLERDVIISVRDHGIGIPAGEQARVFTKFHRGDEARQRGITGTGLGLAMVDYIVKAHQGRVVVESELGKGSTFTISLPSTEARAAGLMARGSG